ncbi:MAG: three-Cys-motif partner protein TcmP [Desulfovibrionaceae bacterium]|nr:three-Cys-motif partner protein TcmP [Desulfovibrionaceae bacterium]
MRKEFHKIAYQAHTLTKLRLYEAYIKAWLPVFMTNSGRVSEIWLFDLFCGPGCDRNGRKGSPLILLNELTKYLHLPSTKNPPKINIIFNDRKKWKINRLTKIIEQRPPLPDIVNIKLTSLPYADIFPHVAAVASKCSTACFIFIDQCGINAIGDNYLRQLASFPITDWLAFVASSSARRFIKHKNLALHLNQKGAWKDAHRTVADTCRELIANPDYFIVPFSIKHGNNIHGLLFGSSHPSGAEKFIKACWAEDKNAGEANFDIDGIIQNSSQLLKFFSKKLDAFEAELRDKIFVKEITNTKEAYEFALQFGVMASHAKAVLRKMKNEGMIANVPPLSYQTTIVRKDIKDITLIR